MRIVCLVTMCSFLNKFSIAVLKRHWTHETQTICWIGTILRPLSQTFLCIGFIYDVVVFCFFFNKQPLFATKHILNPSHENGCDKDLCSMYITFGVSELILPFQWKKCICCVIFAHLCCKDFMFYFCYLYLFTYDILMFMLFNATSATSGDRAVYPSEASEFTPSF